MVYFALREKELVSRMQIVDFVPFSVYQIRGDARNRTCFIRDTSSFSRRVEYINVLCTILKLISQ